MLDELIVSSNLLCAAIERYSAACLAIQRSYARGEKPHITIPQLALRMDAEVEVAASLGLKLRKATAAISWSKNHSSTSTTINSLPSELLAHIFRLVYRSQPCAKRNYDTGDAKAEPIYPAVLALVCSRWREVVSSIPGLWSHIDISTSTLLNRECLNGLMQLHVDRAGQLPLDLHVFDSPSYETSLAYPELVHGLVTQVAGRTFSLDLDLKQDFDQIHNILFSAFFGQCTPRKFTRLTLTQYGRRNTFIVGDNNLDDINSSGLFAGVETKLFEDIMSHVSILRVNQVYPLWTSRAYHGLVELRLTGRQMCIDERELIDILRFSPDLHIFQFNLRINDLLSIDSQITPVPLKKLQVLNLVGMESSQVGHLLRWLSPGPEPLQLGITHSAWARRSLQLKSGPSAVFFSRSCITRVYGQYLELSHLTELLDLSPNLRMLALKGTKLKESAHWKTIKPIAKRQLRCLYMVNCRVHMDALFALINCPAVSIKTISFYRCTFNSGSSQILENEAAAQLDGWARSRPGLGYIMEDFGGPNPVESWKLFPSYET